MPRRIEIVQPLGVVAQVQQGVQRCRARHLLGRLEFVDAAVVVEQPFLEQHDDARIASPRQPDQRFSSWSPATAVQPRSLAPCASAKQIRRSIDQRRMRASPMRFIPRLCRRGQDARVTLDRLIDAAPRPSAAPPPAPRTPARPSPTTQVMRRPAPMCAASPCASAPNTATPIAPADCRAVFRIAAASDERLLSTEDSTVVVIAGTARPMPVGISRKPTSISGRLPVVDASASTPKPARSTSAPTIIGLRVPKRVIDAAAEHVGQEEAGRQRQEGEAGLHRRVVARGLQEQRDDEDRAVVGAVDHGAEEHGAAEVAQREQVGGDHRRGGAPLDDAAARRPARASRRRPARCARRCRPSARASISVAISAPARAWPAPGRRCPAAASCRRWASRAGASTASRRAGTAAR